MAASDTAMTRATKASNLKHDGCLVELTAGDRMYKETNGEQIDEKTRTPCLYLAKYNNRTQIGLISSR